MLFTPPKSSLVSELIEEKAYVARVVQVEGRVTSVQVPYWKAVCPTAVTV